MSISLFSLNLSLATAKDAVKNFFILGAGWGELRPYFLDWSSLFGSHSYFSLVDLSTLLLPQSFFCVFG